MKTIKVDFKIKQGKLQSKSNLDAQLAYLKQAGYRFTHTYWKVEVNHYCFSFV